MAGAGQLEGLNKLPPLEIAPKPGDLFWIDVLQSDGTFRSMKFNAADISGIALNSALYRQQDHITDRDRIFFELQSGEPVTTVQVDSDYLSHLTTDPLRIGANLDGTVSDIIKSGGLGNNQKGEIKAVYDEFAELGSAFTDTLQSIKTEDAGQQNKGTNFYVFDQPKEMTFRSGDVALINCLFFGNAVGNLNLVYRRKGDSQWLVYNASSFPAVNGALNNSRLWVFSPVDPFTYEFNILRASSGADFPVAGYYQFQFEKIVSNEVAAYYGASLVTIPQGNQRIGANTRVAFPASGGNGVLSLPGLKAGDKVLLRISLAVNVLNYQSGATNQYVQPYFRKDNGRWTIIGNTLNFQIHGPNAGTSQDSVQLVCLYEVPGNESGNYHFSFQIDNSHQISNLVMSAQLVDRNTKFRSFYRSSGDIPFNTNQPSSLYGSNYNTLELEQGDVVQLIGQTSLYNSGSRRRWLGAQLTNYLSFSLNSQPFVGVGGSGERTQAGAYRQFGGPAFYEYFFVATHAGTYRFRHEFTSTVSQADGLEANQSTSYFIARKVDTQIHRFRTVLRVNDDSAHSLHTEPRLTAVFSEREVPLNTKTQGAGYVEFKGEPKDGQDFHIGQLNSFSVRKASDNQLFPFVDALNSTQIVYTPFHNLRDILIRSIPFERGQRFFVDSSFPLVAKAGDLFLFKAAGDNLENYRDEDGEKVTTADAGDLAVYDGTNWVRKYKAQPDPYIFENFQSVTPESKDKILMERDAHTDPLGKPEPSDNIVINRAPWSRDRRPNDGKVFDGYSFYITNLDFFTIIKPDGNSVYIDIDLELGDASSDILYHRDIGGSHPKELLFFDKNLIAIHSRRFASDYSRHVLFSTEKSRTIQLKNIPETVTNIETQTRNHSLKSFSDGVTIWVVVINSKTRLDCFAWNMLTGERESEKDVLNIQFAVNETPRLDWFLTSFVYHNGKAFMLTEQISPEFIPSWRIFVIDISKKQRNTELDFDVPVPSITTDNPLFGNVGDRLFVQWVYINNPPAVTTWIAYNAEVSKTIIKKVSTDFDNFSRSVLARQRNDFSIDVYAFLDGRNVLNSVDELLGEHEISLNVRNLQNIPIKSGDYKIVVSGRVKDLSPNTLKEGLNNLTFELDQEDVDWVEGGFDISEKPHLNFQLTRDGIPFFSPILVRIDPRFPSASRFVETTETAWLALGMDRNANTWYYGPGFLARGTVKVSG